MPNFNINLKIKKDPVIFSGSLKMNIDPFDTCSEQEIWNVLERLDLKGYVQGLENQLNFECSESGENFR
jgi:ABC-type multidrug transport system fused ATPase/permease subunit